MAKIDEEQISQIEGRVIDLVIRLMLLALFVYWSVALLRPFLPIIVWSIVLAVALAPIHRWLTVLLGGRRGLASTLLTLATLIVIVGPLAALATSFIETVQSLVVGAGDHSLQLPGPPAFVVTFPLVGERIAGAWTLVSTDLDEALVRFREIIGPVGGRLLKLLSSISFDLIKFMVSTIVAGILLVPGPLLAGSGKRLASRILAPRGAQFVDLAGATIRNVSRGVVGVAILQSLLIGVVLEVFGVPSAGLLAFVILFLCLLQIGPGLVVLPLLIWAWVTLTAGQAILLTALLVPLTFMDNVLKPMIMGKGLSTPTLVIFLGVMGGTLTYGLIGLFLGPAVLAVFYDLLRSWALFDRPVEDESDPPNTG
ncbi:AI-2E family transporter [Stappia indica]|uniref:AI-2E family transporter n=1 Tax=Stappia indica TaxID=538381 RepID=UPI001CD6E4AB|nr:AI-2E family transporter [Stappia indica]MCA1300556.1 AI-2E family transporter [Stappia indica]